MKHQESAESSRMIAVTGANRGLGLEIARQLARMGQRVILACRTQPKAQAAAEVLRAEGLEGHPMELDAADEKSIRAFADRVRREFGRLDGLVNNAGVALDGGAPGKWSDADALSAPLDRVRATLETNLYGPLLLCQEFIPLMRSHGFGRIVNLSSGMGQLSDMNGGFIGYRISKTGLNVVTRVLADELKGENILVNSVCPGWVHTDMGGPQAPRTPAEGADTPVWLATLPDGGPSGGFFRDRKPIPW
ncbi:MAG: SDR family oxidoreductase [Deltaproteobacteria bacterium]|nr:SDR family oxidoreductase [Deltaproteobacteria bacterium]